MPAGAEGDRVDVTPHLIYIVVASCGEYSDHSEWFVCWRTTREEATEVARTCAEQAFGVLMCFWNRKGLRYWEWKAPGEPSNAAWGTMKTVIDTLLDRQQQGHTEGLRYDVFSIADDPAVQPVLLASFLAEEPDAPQGHCPSHGFYECMHCKATCCMKCDEHVEGDGSHKTIPKWCQQPECRAEWRKANGLPPLEPLSNADEEAAMR